MIDINVQKSLGDFQISAKIGLESDGVIALFGRSGSGKTSLVNMIAGLTTPDSGTISIAGKTLFDFSQGINVPPEQRSLGYVFQEDRLFPHMSVASNLSYGMPKGASEVKLKQVVELLGIGDLLDRRPHNLSGGEKQRVSIGRALLADPKLLLMDEPLASLDASRKDEILPFIEELSNELKLPVFYVSHSMEEIVRLADTLVLMSDGEIAAAGPLEEITSRLDLRPLTGRYEAGSVINVVVSQHDEQDQLSELSFREGKFVVPRLDLPIGKNLRVRIRARDVSISTQNPENISINNILYGKIQEIGEEEFALTDVLVDVGVPIWARISRRSIRRLQLGIGSTVYVMVKAVAIDRSSLGGHGRGRFLK